MTHLFHFTLGPVQGFISQARKTSDFYAGSLLLSKLTMAAVKEFQKHGNIIVPYITEQQQKIPNRFVGEIHETGKNLTAIGKAVEQAAKSELETIFRNLPASISNNIHAEQQITSLLETYWAFEAIDNDYIEAYNKLDRKLGGLKSLREFQQTHQSGEAGRKCSVDGERNVVVYRRTADETTNPASLFPALKNIIEECAHDDEQTHKIWEISQGEGLSAVTYLKRRYLAGTTDKWLHEFPSTTGISLMHIRKAFTTDYDRYNASIRHDLGHSNDQFFYQDNLNQSTYRKVKGSSNNANQFIAAREAELRLVTKKAKAGNLPFLKYYALISFDGDNMGKWFSGNNLRNGQDMKSFHKDLSEKLNDYAKVITNHINSNQYGKVVYAGEDFLAFLNLMDLMQVLKWLRQQWNALVHEPLSIKYQFADNAKLSFSAGIVIAHYKEPLSLVMQQLRTTASDAKKGVLDKDAFALKVIKHSGNDLVCTYAFDLLLLDKLADIRERLRTDEFSAAFISKYLLEIRPLGNSLPKSLIEAELKRFIKRACNITGATSAMAINDMLQSVNYMLAKNTDTAGKVSDNFAQTLAIIDFLERKVKGKN